MKNLFVTFLCILTGIACFANDNEFWLSGRVKESFAKTDLTNAYVLLYDSAGNVADTIRANQGRAWHSWGIDTIAMFTLPVSRVDSTYYFEIECDGYKPVVMSYRLENIGKRETHRDMGIFFLERAPLQLKEVIVTTSKIKFYNSGDTLVYNADAFMLANGSMLDALIAQLPGVELNTNGQIKVNGEFVESLLLDGKKFFDGDNNLMLENIAAYTVKDIKVFEGVGKRDELEGNTANKVLTMDVRLKKEYNIGWMVNAQGGLGTDKRYLAKTMLAWFNPTTRVTLLGNLNNLNSNRTPGRDDTWTPDQMPDGVKTYAVGGVNYNYEHPERKRYAEGSAMFVQSIDNLTTTTNRINFLPGTDTYENSYDKSHNRVSSFTTNHYFNILLSDPMNIGLDANGSYTYGKNNAFNLSGTFSKDPGEMSREMLDAIYSAGNDTLQSTILNRAKTLTNSWDKSYNISLAPSFTYNIPKSNDYLTVNLRASYESHKEQLWRDYQINFGTDATAVENIRQFNNGSPNNTKRLAGSVRYMTMTEKQTYWISYEYTYSDHVKDSYLYALDQLTDMGIYGGLPENYLLAFDPRNSYISRKINHNNTLSLRYNYDTGYNKKQRFIFSLIPKFSIDHYKFDYFSNNQQYNLTKTYASVIISGYMGAMLELQFNNKTANNRSNYRNSVRYSYSVTPTLPDPYDMIDIVNDANPLNIYVGNPNLKMAWRHRHLFRWAYSPHSHTLNNILYLSYTHASNSLTRGYTYNTSTGVRFNKMYNVNGNRTYALTNELSWQFGATKQFTLTSMTDGILATYNDMIGTNLEAPQKVTVKNNTLTEKIRLSWGIGRQNLGLRCEFTTRHTTSEDPGFNTINATHINYGLSDLFTLPAGFGLSTDLMCYTRRGYGLDYLDTTDLVWNMRFSYVPPKLKHLTFMIDGFDMLHQLSNVNYSVTASGRTVSYTNTIPRYVMLSVQYRLNIQPKKR